MGELFVQREARFRVPAGAVPALADAIRPLATTALFDQIDARDATSANAVGLLAGAGFDVRVADDGALVELSYTSDKLPSDADLDDVARLFRAMAPFVERGSLVSFGYGGRVYTYRFTGHTCTVTSRKVVEPASTNPYVRAYDLLREGKLEAGLAVFDAMLVRASARAPILEARQGYLVTAGRYEEAVATCRDALALAPSPSLWSALGKALGRLGRLEEAEAAVRQSGDEGALFSFFVEHQRWAPLLEVVERMTDREDAARMWRPEILCALARFEDAAEILSQGALDGSQSFLRARAYLELARYEDAALDAARAWPERSATHVEILVTLGRRAEADAICNDLLAWAARISRGAPSLEARALFWLGRIDEAVGPIERHLADPNFGRVGLGAPWIFSKWEVRDTLELAARIYVAVKRPSDALVVADRGLALTPAWPALLYVRAQALVMLDRRDEARAALARAVATSPHRARLARQDAALATLS